MSTPPLQPAPNESTAQISTFSEALLAPAEKKAEASEKEKRAQKRLHARLAYSLVTKNLEGKDAKLSGYTEDISVGGVSILTPINLKLKSKVAIRIELFYGGQSEHVIAIGKLIYQSVAAKMGGFRYGVQFLKINAKYVKVIEKYIQAMSKSGLL